MPKIIILDYSAIDPSSFSSQLNALYEKCNTEKQDSIFIKCPIPGLIKPETIKVAIGSRENYENIKCVTFEKLIAKIRGIDHFELMEGITYKISVSILKYILQQENGVHELKKLLSATINILSQFKSNLTYNDFIFVYCGEAVGFGVKTAMNLTQQASIAPFYSGEIDLAKGVSAFSKAELYGYCFDLKNFLNIENIFDGYFCDPDGVHQINAYHFGGILSFINHQNDPCCSQFNEFHAYQTKTAYEKGAMLNVSYGDQYEFLVRSCSAEFISSIPEHIKKIDSKLPKQFSDLYARYFAEQKTEISVEKFSLFNDLNSSQEGKSLSRGVALGSVIASSRSERGNPN